MVSSNNKIVSSRFFEQSQFEQFTMSQGEDSKPKGRGLKSQWNGIKTLKK
jgi:hypothetical protein